MQHVACKVSYNQSFWINVVVIIKNSKYLTHFNQVKHKHLGQQVWTYKDRARLNILHTGYKIREDEMHHMSWRGKNFKSDTSCSSRVEPETDVTAKLFIRGVSSPLQWAESSTWAQFGRDCFVSTVCIPGKKRRKPQWHKEVQHSSSWERILHRHCLPHMNKYKAVCQESCSSYTSFNWFRFTVYEKMEDRKASR